ncbi:hypothetical protein Val02_47560 [Virgisporangium aliadipatigenens]|uniref:Uncharacterized protein n=1 Tax=Virgisporangium aliadipatigenens TaxID=741659 RepID=A0A8J3YQ09_9ACTN|nr:aroma-sacti cluster domain-containing protein [Virgisporangium aliadipatigenens]GIJ47870.1 hypothetical protein Val02_47560 [Virgisporangium aliadipatigenens]
MTDGAYTVEELEAHGFPVHDLTEEQRDVLRNLTPEEFAILVDVRARLEAVGPEVQAHAEIAGAALF